MHTTIAIVSKQLNDFNYCYVTLIILFSINTLFANNEVVSSVVIECYSFICTHLNGSKYFYVIPIILFRHTIKDFPAFLFNTNHSIENFSFVCTVKWFKYCFVSLTIQLNISHLFTHKSNSSISNNSIYYNHLFAHSLSSHRALA